MPPPIENPNPSSWQPDIVKWDTDTESDGSEDEENNVDFEHELTEEQLLRLMC